MPKGRERGSGTAIAAPTSSASRARELLKGLGLLSASLLVCFAVLEACAYFFFWGDQAPNLSVYVEDLHLGKRLRPGFVGEHYGSPVRINSHGMRDREFDPVRTPGSTRILVLGDSWTFGVGMKDEETWPKRLESLLRATGRPIEVMNTGVSGYETYHEAIYYNELKGFFEHDLILVGLYPVNDVHDKGRRYARYRALHDISPWLLELYRLPKRLYVAQLYKNWRVTRKHRRRAAHYAAKSAPPDSAATPAKADEPGFAAGEDDWTELYNESFSGWVQMREALDSIGASVRDAGVTGVVVLFPDLRDLGLHRHYSHPRVEPLIRAAVEAAGLVLIDVMDDFASYIGREAEVSGFVGSTHPNARGYDLIARSVARELESRDLLGASAEPRSSR